MQNLLEFKVETNPSLKRKVDFYFTPYNPGYLMDKHMKFDESETNKGAQRILAGQKGKINKNVA